MGNITATPRKEWLGLLADGLEKANNFATANNPPVNLLSNLLGIPGLQRTLNELSYGGALGTGSGMTWKPKDDTIDAVGLLAPAVAKAPAAINKGAASIGKAAEPAVNRLVASTMERGGMPAQLLQDMSQGTQSHIFIGKNAKTWDKAAADKAEGLLAQGVDPRKVWEETGTWKAPDGKLRQEIADNKAWYDKEALGDLKSMEDFDYLKNTQPLGGVIEHKELYNAYPDAIDIPVHFMPAKNMRGAYGAYSGPADAITLTDKATDQTSGAIHEIQHAIQQREGFANGGSSTMAFSDPQAWAIYKGLLGDMRVPLSMKDYAKQAWGTDSITQEVADAYKQYAKQVKSSITPEIDRAAQETAAKEYYKRLAGEAEARATQARLGLNAEQRRALFPEDSYDVPINQLIVRGLLNP